MTPMRALSLSSAPCRLRGFTLVELMIVVAVIGILAGIAYPSYSDYVTRGRFPDATTQLATRQVRMEQWFQDNRTYAGAPAAVCPGAPDALTSRFFDFSCVSTATTYTLTATGKGAMTDFSFTIDQANNRRTLLGATRIAAGWGPAPANCWLARKGGQC